MAGWSTLTNGSTLDSRENVCVHPKNGLVFGGESGDDHETDESDVGVKFRLRTLFDEVMSLFIKAIGEKGMFRPVPAMLPCEKSVDLFYLFWVVREKGGYESVSKKKLWGFVAKKLGLGLGAGAMAAVKLVYFKYLSELEQWLNNRGKCGPCGNFGLLSLELETEFRDLFSDCRLVQIEKRKKLCSSDSKCSGSVKCNGDNADIEFGDKDRDDDADDDDDDDDESDRLLVLNSSGDDKKEKDNKRKRESLSLSGLVKWLAERAKHSGDPSTGAIGGPSSKLKEHEEKELWAQAIRARDVLLLRRHVVSNNQESLLQKKQKMHPSMYEDDIAPSHQSSDKSRCSKRLTNLAKSRLCSCCNSCLPSPSKLIKSPRKVEVDNEPKEEAAIEDDLPALANEACPLEDESVEKHFSVGPLFQADVPEWTGAVSESDPKWLGTRVWPLECREHKYPTAETDTIGKGRPEFCDCSLPGSVECVRFHIAEARMKLKLELAPAFYHWKFNHMGEEVSLRWTAEQEKRFKDIVTSNRYFGDRKIRWFPTKTMENMVSYYFNVFLVQKRSYQNRVTPKDIDSDDDEKEFGSVGGPFGNNVVDISGICVQNKQCTDFE